MRLYFLLVRRVPPVPSPLLVQVCELLTWRGFEIESGIAEEMLNRPELLEPAHDLYVLKSHTELSLSVAGILHAGGARMLNPYESCIATQDKIVAARRLSAAGIPIPRSWITGDLALLNGIVERTNLIVKPHRGHRGAGIATARTADELAALPPPETALLAQELVDGSGEDLKVYVVGDQIRAVRKPFSAHSFAVPGMPCEVTGEVRDIALRCGQALGLGLYGLDVIETENGPVVVDVNYFPGYKGVPGAAPLIADYIEGYARENHGLELPPVAPPRAPEPEPVKKRFLGVDHTLAAIVAEGFLSRLSFGLVTFALPLYAVRELGMSLAQVGFLLSFNLMVAVALKPLMGSLADRFGLKRSLSASIGLRSLVSLLLAFAALPWQLFAVRGLHGVSMSLRDPAVNALIAEHGGKRTMASAFAWYQTAKSVAGAAGKFLAGLILALTASNFSMVFLIAFALSALPLVVVARYVARTGSAPLEPGIRTEAGSDQAADAAEGNRPAMLPFMGLGFLITGTAYMLTNLFPVFAVEYAGLSEGQAGAIYGLSALVSLSAPGFGWLSDNVSRKLVLSLRSVANVLSSVLYLVAPNLAGLAAGRALDDMGKAAFRPAWGSLMAHVSSYDRRRRARTMGYLSVGEDAGEMTGPVVAGILWSTWGVPVLLGVRIGLAVVTEIYTAAVTGSLRRLDGRAATAQSSSSSGLPASSDGAGLSASGDKEAKRHVVPGIVESARATSSAERSGSSRESLASSSRSSIESSSP